MHLVKANGVLATRLDDIKNVTMKWTGFDKAALNVSDSIDFIWLITSCLCLSMNIFLLPGMADRGMGLRVFRTKDELSAILEDLEAGSNDDDDVDDDDSGGQLLSQLRHFVVQVRVYPIITWSHSWPSRDTYLNQYYSTRLGQARDTR